MKMTDKMFEPQDDYERDLIEALENGEYEPVPIGKEEMKELQDAARRKLDELDIKKQISLKIRESDLKTIKSKAKEVSIPYQNIIQALVHKYATGQIKLEI
jgi:predicted DNA binding CopG/RHH family protein